MSTNAELVARARALPAEFRAAQFPDGAYDEDADLAELDAVGFLAVDTARRLADALERTTRELERMDEAFDRDLPWRYDEVIEARDAAVERAERAEATLAKVRDWWLSDGAPQVTARQYDEAAVLLESNAPGGSFAGRAEQAEDGLFRTVQALGFDTDDAQDAEQFFGPMTYIRDGKPLTTPADIAVAYAEEYRRDAENESESLESRAIRAETKLAALRAEMERLHDAAVAIVPVKAIRALLDAGTENGEKP